MYNDFNFFLELISLPLGEEGELIQNLVESGDSTKFVFWNDIPEIFEN
jgi:hypothetical protein